jgi:hypothetical protein
VHCLQINSLVTKTFILTSIDYDENKFESKLRKLSKQQLIEFMIKKGDTRKHEQAFWAKHVTKDKEEIEDMT